MVVGQFVLTRTSFGVKLKLTGSSPRAAKLSGIAVERVILVSFVLAAFTATIAGLAVTSLSRVGAWYNGAGYDFKAVTAIVIGGMTLAGGRGTILGVLGGSLIIGILNNIMTLLGIGTFSQDMIRGAIFIIVVGINALSLRRLGGRCVTSGRNRLLRLRGTSTGSISSSSPCSPSCPSWRRGSSTSATSPRS